MAVRKKINLSNLIVNIKNPRHEAVEMEQNAMEFLISEDIEGMYNLANSIVVNGYFPAQTLSVLELKEKNGFFVLLDGNRRMTAIKVLTNPEIIPNMPQKMLKFKNSIKALSSSWELKLEEFECVIYDKKEDAAAYLLSIHTDDKNYPGPKKWNRIQQDRFKEASDGEVSLAYKVITKNLPGYDVNSIKNLSTIDRIVNTSEVKLNLLKIDSNDGSSKLTPKIIKSTLVQIIEDVVNSNKYSLLGNYKTINTRLSKDEIVNYINILLNNIVNTTVNTIPITPPVQPTTSVPPITPPNPLQPVQPVGGNNGNSSGTPQTPGNNNPVGNRRTRINGYDGLAFEYIEARTVNNTVLANKGILELCNELKIISSSTNNYYKTFPIATATLIRALLEETLKYSIRERNLWATLSNNGTILEGNIGLKKLIDFCTRQKNIIFPDSTKARCFDSFANNLGTKDYFDMVIHHPAKVQSNPNVLKDIANSGLYEFIYYLLN